MSVKIKQGLEELLLLPSWGEIEFAKVNWLVQHWLIRRGRYHAVHPVPPSLCELRAHKNDITREYLTYLSKSGLCIPRYSEIDPIQALVTDADIETAWRVLHLRIYGQDTKLVESFPKTIDALSVVEHEFPTIMFSVLEPGKSIPPHTGFYCGVLRYHLGLIVPGLCSIDVDGQNLRWEPDILFDDTFIHSVNNPSHQNRIVLFLDVVRDFGDDSMNQLNKRILQKAKECNLVQGDVARVNALTL